MSAYARRTAQPPRTWLVVVLIALLYTIAQDDDRAAAERAEQAAAAAAALPCPENAGQIERNGKQVCTLKNGRIPTGKAAQ